MKYEFWTDGYANGFKCVAPSGRVTFLYLNPSSEDSESIPNVFLYEGPYGNPAMDSPITYIVTGDREN